MLTNFVDYRVELNNHMDLATEGGKHLPVNELTWTTI